MKRYLQRIVGTTWDERGVTGLETAIILIAFVVVASVFAFTVLSTGVFSAERGKETVFAGLEEAQSSLQSSGQLTAERGDVEGTNSIVKVKFVVTTAVSGQSMDLTPPNTSDGSGNEPDVATGETKMIISYSDENQFINDLDWSIDFIGKTDGDNILDEDEQAEITVWLHNYNSVTPEYELGVAGTTDQYLTTRLCINTKFRVEVKPGAGSTLTLERNTPPRLQPIMQMN